jgi:hypothetical protein
MSTQVKFRRGTATQHASFTGALGEITFDTTNLTARYHDGSTVGGFIGATRDWVSSQIIAGVSDGSLTPVKFAATAQNTVLGRIASGSGDPAWLTATQARQALGASTIGGNIFSAADGPSALLALGQPGLSLYQTRNFR